MKKIIVGLLAVASMSSASAVTWWVNGVLYGNVCRSGIYYTIYPIHMGQPVGTLCPVRDIYGNIVLTGRVTAE